MQTVEYKEVKIANTNVPIYRIRVILYHSFVAEVEGASLVLILLLTVNYQ